MANDFPLVGVIAPNFLYRSMIGPALALGVDLRLLGTEMSSISQKLPGCNVVTFAGIDFPIPTIRTLEAAGVSFRPSAHLMDEVANRNSLASPASELNPKIEVFVARSPHAQASVWMPTEIINRDGVHRLSISPPREISPASLANLQARALEIAQELEMVGVGNFQFERECLHT